MLIGLDKKNVTKDRCNIPMDMTMVLGPHKFNLYVPINHHGPSTYSGHYITLSTVAKSILLQRQQNNGFFYIMDTKRTSAAYVLMNELIM